MTTYAHDFVWQVPVSIEQTFAALTKRDSLTQWFCEFADVDLRIGGRYQFWGKHSFDTRSRKHANQIITNFNPPTEISYTWRLLGRDSAVAYSLSALGSDADTQVTGQHRVSGIPEGGRSDQLIEDLWRISGGNFRAFLDGGKGICLPDYSDPAPEVRMSIYIHASRSDVFDALTTPEIMIRWLGGQDPIVEPKTGGDYTYGWSYEVGERTVRGGPTKILEYVKNERLVTDWPDWRGDESVPDQTITWILDDEGDGTRLTLIHSGFVRPVDTSDYPFGWCKFIEALRTTMELLKVSHQ